MPPYLRPARTWTFSKASSFELVQGFKVKIYDGPLVPLPARPGVASVDKVQAVISSFVGIPYAKPPVNEGRFRPPRPHQGWQVHQAIEFKPACPQPVRILWELRNKRIHIVKSM